MSAVAVAAQPRGESPSSRRPRATSATTGWRVAGAARCAALRAAAAIFAPWIAPHDPERDRPVPPAAAAGLAAAANGRYPLGCDALGRDILSRIIYGARVSILIGARRRADRDHRRHPRRARRRLSARLGGHGHLAARRYPARLSLPDLRHRPDGDDGRRASRTSSSRSSTRNG